MSVLSPDRYIRQAEIEMVAVDVAAVRQFGGEFLAGSLILEAGRLALLDEFPEVIERIRPDESDFPHELGVLTAADFQRMLHGIKSTDFAQTAIEVAATAINHYGDFTPQLSQFQADIRAYSAKVIGSGSESNTYIMPDGQIKYAVHIPHAGPSDPISRNSIFNVVDLFGGPDRYMAFKTADRAATLAFGYGIENAQQLVTYSAPEKICLSGWVDGKGTHQFYVDDIADIKPDHIRQYVRTIKKLAERGLATDHGMRANNPANIIWHPDNGFTIIDYRRESPNRDQLLDSIHQLVKGLTCAPDTFNNSVQAPDPLKTREAEKLIILLRDQTYKELGLLIETDAYSIDRAIANRTGY